MTSGEPDQGRDELSALRPIDQLCAHLTRFGRPTSESLTRHVVDYALALAEQEGADAAAADVLELSQKFDLTLEDLFEINRTLIERDPRFSSTTLFSYYIRNGGVQRTAFEYEIYRLGQIEDDTRIIAIFNLSKKWMEWQSLRKDVLFLVSNAFMKKEMYDQCFNVLSYLLKEYPEETFFKRNMMLLASQRNHKEAISVYRDLIEEISASYISPTQPAPANAPSFIIDLNLDTEDKILESLRLYGFCHIKNGCKITLIEDLMTHILATEQDLYFPCTFDPYVLHSCSALFRFDAPSIANALLQGNAAIDPETSIVRKVDPGDSLSFTPFHQDATAFQKAVVNIWTPLTPAGGEYPTIEFVKRRLTSAEHTLETSDGYNLVKIDDAEILTKYKDDLYEPTDVAPGECILFLGTTIHRSTNLRASTKPRYNLEVRWS